MPKKSVETRTETTANPADGPDDATASSQTIAALDLIRSRIIDLSIAPGSRIDENLLLRDFALGRTPAREAINRLAAEGFVSIVPNRGGTFVRKLDMEEIGQIIVAHQLSENILGQMCRFEDAALADDLSAIQERYRSEVADRNYLAITALNERFHMRMNQSIGNSYIYEFAQSTHRHVRRLNVQLYKLEAADPELHGEQFDQNLREHDEIIAIIRRRDRDALVRLLPEHARATQDRLVRIMQSNTAKPFMLSIEPLKP